MKFKKAIKSFFSGLMAAADGDNPDAGVKVDMPFLMVGRCDKCDTFKKLEAAADALREIECLTAAYTGFDGKPNPSMDRIHTIAQDGYRAATKK